MRIISISHPFPHSLTHSLTNVALGMSRHRYPIVVLCNASISPSDLDLFSSERIGTRNGKFSSRGEYYRPTNRPTNTQTDQPTDKQIIGKLHFQKVCLGD